MDQIDAMLNQNEENLKNKYNYDFQNEIPLEIAVGFKW